MSGEKVLQGAGFLHPRIHGIFIHIRISHGHVQVVHLLLHLKEVVKSGFQHVPYGLPLGEDGVLVQIARTNALRPFHFSFIRRKLTGDDIHKSRLAFSVGAHQSDVFTGQKSEGYIIENLAVSKSVGQVFHV